MPKYIVSPVTLYDSEQEQFETKVGEEGKMMPLHFTAWGNTENESRNKAIKIAEILTKELKINLETNY